MEMSLKGSGVFFNFKFIKGHLELIQAIKNTPRASKDLQMSIPWVSQKELSSHLKYSGS